MATLSPDQRNYYYLLETERVGIHKPILAALYQAHCSPLLPEGETGLGVSPANRVALAQVNTFAEQVQYAANAIRSLTDSLIAQGWQGADLWNPLQGSYADRFLQKVAKGYAPGANESTIARLEACNFDKLRQAYRADLEADFKAAGLPQTISYLDQALLALVDGIPDHYTGLPYQRSALLEAVRIVRELDTPEAALASLLPAADVGGASDTKLRSSLVVRTDAGTPGRGDAQKMNRLRMSATWYEDESVLDIPLKQFIRQLAASYRGYPQQREALIRMTQVWRQLRTREEAIASLKTNTSPKENLRFIDPALMAFIGRLSQSYQGKGNQRNALTEAFRLWHQLDSRPTALAKLGINPELLNTKASDRTAMVNLATQLDRELLTFVRRLPGDYQELDHQREALIRLIQLWRNLPSLNPTIQSLLEDQKRWNHASRNAQEASPKPMPVVMPKRPVHWTPDNIQIWASIVEDGNFTWAEATQGGLLMPPNQVTVDAIVRIAKLAQRARDRIGRPFLVTSWYRPPQINRAIGGVPTSRHLIGDAIDFTCEGLTGNQVYWFLDPWWPGGLGRYTKFLYLCHIDASSYRVRWRD